MMPQGIICPWPYSLNRLCEITVKYEIIYLVVIYAHTYLEETRIAKCNSLMLQERLRASACMWSIYKHDLRTLYARNWSGNALEEIGENIDAFAFYFIIIYNLWNVLWCVDWCEYLINKRWLYNFIFLLI